MAGKRKAGIIFAGLTGALVLLLTSCDFQLMSDREVEQTLGRNYGREFTVISSERISSDDYSSDVYRAKVYVVSPKDDPETQFFAFNTVRGESFGVPGFANGFSDTYALDIFREAFERRAADTDVEYSFDYIYPVRSSSVYYSDLHVDIDPVSSENLEAVCEVLSLAFTDTLEEVPEAREYFIGATIWIRYREPEWPEKETCVIRMDPFYGIYWNAETSKYERGTMDTDAGSIRKYILHEAAKD